MGGRAEGGRGVRTSRDWPWNRRSKLEEEEAVVEMEVDGGDISGNEERSFMSSWASCWTVGGKDK